MKFCPYCGARQIVGAASFCPDCGESLDLQTDAAKSKSPQTHPKGKKHRFRFPMCPQKRRNRRHTELANETLVTTPVANDGYDGYYDDVPPEDNGHTRERMDPKMLKKVALLIGGVLLVIVLAILLMLFV